MRALAGIIGALLVGTHAAAVKPKSPKAVAVTTTTTSGVDPKQLLLAGQLADAAAPVAGGMAGANVSYTYGFYQVTVQLSGSTLTDCKIVYQTNYPRSHDINEGADGTLCQEALAAQSAAIHNVSGATMTTNVFEASLQSALVKAHLTALGSVIPGPY